MQLLERHDLSICDDCLQLIANGEDHSEEGDLDARIEANWPSEDGWLIDPNCDPEYGCESFSWQPCEACYRHWGGTRHDAIASKYAELVKERQDA